MVRIDKNVAMPEAPKGRKMKYPWTLLEVGDSFLMNGATLAVARVQARQAGTRYKKKFDAQMHKGKVRVWRWG